MVDRRRWLHGFCGRALPMVAGIWIFSLLLDLRPDFRQIASEATAPEISATPRLTFVGAQMCAECHSNEARLWKGSHHQLAMQEANANTVLGDFHQARFKNVGVTSTFFRKGSQFWVRTDGPDGALHDYQIKFTFGVYPLQQYLIEMPGGRLQALGIAWDSRSPDQGGGHWFFLYPGQKITNKDPLHWSGIDQNWNYMCADCHSTDVRRNYSAVERTFSTKYSEIDVACEACHGPGSAHLAWAKRQAGWRSLNSTQGLAIQLDERRNVKWYANPGSGEVLRSTPRRTEREIQMCARCHSRRGQIHEDYVHGQEVENDYRVALLEPSLYYPDGQIKAEDYEYGSFSQSKMFHRGVTCSDCHDPHSLKIRADGNALCVRCHSSEKYGSAKHHFHKPNSAGAQCVSCHMPTRTYMTIDVRRDHSLRVPRPEQFAELHVPNACIDCHKDKPSQWASVTVENWYGHKPLGFQRFAEALHAGANGAPGAAQQLANLVIDRDQPAIARATALSQLADYSVSPTDSLIETGITDASALVRGATADALSNSDPRASVAVLARLLTDPVRAVRIKVAEVLAGTPADSLPAGVAEQLKRAVREYVDSLELSADRPESHMNLGLLYEKLGRFDNAEAEFEAAIVIDPTFAPAAVDLADLYRRQNQDQKGDRILRAAIDRLPDDASLQYALGLTMIREKHYDDAMQRLAAAVHYDPKNPRYNYVYAVALYDSGRKSDAIATLEASLKSNAYDQASLSSLTEWLGESGNSAEALVYAKRLEQLEPDNAELQNLIANLRVGRIH
jgi:predicted CXXCH cytochrome family protein